MNNCSFEIKNDFWKDQMKLPVWAKDESVLGSISLTSIFSGSREHKLGGMRG